MLIRQLDKKLAAFQQIADAPTPSNGWINAIRTGLNMSFKQLAQKMNISAQAVKGIEDREKTGGITLNTLRDTATALNMRFVYGFVPQDGSLEKMIEQKAYEAARLIVQRTSTTMKLEDQENSQSRLTDAIKELAEEIKKEVPKHLWD